MQYSDNPEITSLLKLLSLTLNGRYRGAGWKSIFFRKWARGRIMTLVVEHIVGVASVLSAIYTTPRDCAALDYSKTTTDVTLDQQMQTGTFRKMANLKVFLCRLPLHDIICFFLHF